MRGKALTPTFTAFAVVSLLESHFPDLVDTGFTSRMEQKLDEIAIGKTQWLPYLQGFFLGESGLENQVKVRQDEIDPAIAKAIELENLAAKVKIGKFGPYIEIPQGEEIITASIPQDLTPADLNPEQVAVLLKQKTEGPDKVGIHPETGEPIFILIGAYGPYVQLGEATEENKKPKRTSLPKGVKPEDVTLEMAVGLLALPRNLGEHPESGKNIKASLGRFGPYVVHDQGKDGKDYRSLKGDDDVLTISLERALELLAEPKRGRGSRTPLKQLGLHPEDQEPVNLFKGPYGVYIKHGKVNASLPEGETEETITLEKALPLLAEKAGSSKKTSRKKATATAKGTKKTTNKRASATGAAKKTTTKRTTTRKKSASKAANPDQSSEAS
jgi:DNA topoisomerase-1